MFNKILIANRGGEGGVLREEAIARVDRIGFRGEGGLDQDIRIQIGFFRRCRTDVNSLVGELGVQ